VDQRFYPAAGQTAWPRDAPVLCPGSHADGAAGRFLGTRPAQLIRNIRRKTENFDALLDIPYTVTRSAE